MIGSRSAKPRLSLSATSAILCAPNAGSHEIKVDKMVPVMVAVLLGELEVSVFVMVSEEVKLIGRSFCERRETVFTVGLQGRLFLGDLMLKLLTLSMARVPKLEAISTYTLKISTPFI